MKKKLLRRRADIIFIVLLLILCWYAWRMLPEIVLRSDGFAHMLPSEQSRFWSTPARLTGIEVGASILGAILPKLFGLDMSSYLLFELVIILLIDALFYLLVRIVTGSSIIAFASSLIAGVSYFGNWDNYGTHCYCFFLERVVNMVVMIPSFTFLHLFFTSGKKKFYIISLLLYFVGIKLGHLELLLTPFFVFYPFFWYLSSRQVLKGLLLGISFGIASVSIILIQGVSYSGIGPPWTLLEFLFNPNKYNYFQAIWLQLVFWSQYQPILPNLSSYALYRFLSIENAMKSIPYFIIVYTFFFGVLYKYLPKYRPLLLTCASSIIAIFFLNAYIKLPEIVVTGANRYLYFPTFPLSIFWGIAIWHFFLKKRDIRYLLGVFILAVFYYINLVLLEDIFRQTFEWNKSTKAFFSHVVETRDALSPNTLVVVPRPEFWVQEDEFFTVYLGKGNVRYISENNGYYDWRNIASSSAHVIKLSYDSVCNCVKETKIK